MSNPYLALADEPRNRNPYADLARIDAGTAFMRGLGDGLTIGFGDELMGAGAGISALLQGRDYLPAYQRQVALSRANLAEAQEDRPWATGGGELVGIIGSTFVPGGMIARGARATTLGGRLGRAALAGSAFGALSGVGEGVTPEERLRGGATGAALGAVLGGGMQALGEGGGRLGSMAWRALGLPQGGGTAGVVAADLARTASQNPQLNVGSSQDLLRVIDDAAMREPNMMVAEALGQPGVSRLAALSRMRGETGQRVEDFVTARNRNMGAQLEDAFLRSPQSGDALEQSVREAWRTQGAELYRPLLSAPLSRAGREAFQRLEASPLFQHRAIQSAWRHAQGMIADDVALGRLTPDLAQSVPTRLHYAKVMLDDMLADPTKLEPGLRNMSNASIEAARQQLLTHMERIIPGYDAARAQLADIGAARRAIEMGRQAFTRQRFPSNEALAREFSRLTPAERPYFIAGMEDWIANAIQQGGRDGHRNVALQLLNDRFQSRLRIVLGRDAEPLLQRARTLSRMFETGNWARPSRGSITSNMGFEAMDAPRIPTKEHLVNRVMEGAWDQTVGRLGERNRNLLGQLYAMPVSEFRARSPGLLSRARLQDRLAAEERRRLQAGRNALGVGAGWGYGAAQFPELLQMLFGGGPPANPYAEMQ